MAQAPKLSDPVSVQPITVDLPGLGIVEFPAGTDMKDPRIAVQVQKMVAEKGRQDRATSLMGDIQGDIKKKNPYIDEDNDPILGRMYQEPGAPVSDAYPALGGMLGGAAAGARFGPWGVVGGGILGGMTGYGARQVARQEKPVLLDMIGHGALEGAPGLLPMAGGLVRRGASALRGTAERGAAAALNTTDLPAVRTALDEGALTFGANSALRRTKSALQDTTKSVRDLFGRLIDDADVPLPPPAKPPASPVPTHGPIGPRNTPATADTPATKWTSERNVPTRKPDPPAAPPAGTPARDIPGWSQAESPTSGFQTDQRQVPRPAWDAPEVPPTPPKPGMPGWSQTQSGGHGVGGPPITGKVGWAESFGRSAGSPVTRPPAEPPLQIGAAERRVTRLKALERAEREAEAWRIKAEKNIPQAGDKYEHYRTLADDLRGHLSRTVPAAAEELGRMGELSRAQSMLRDATKATKSKSFEILGSTIPNPSRFGPSAAQLGSRTAGGLNRMAALLEDPNLTPLMRAAILTELQKEKDE